MSEILKSTKLLITLPFNLILNETSTRIAMNCQAIFVRAM